MKRFNYLITVLFTLICGNTSFSQSRKLSQRYAKSETVLDPSGSLLLQWNVDYSLKKISFKLTQSDKAPTFNWFALGFSDRGDLANSDVCLLWTDYKGNTHFEDMHADGCGRLERDLQQDCEGAIFDASSGTIIFERYFNTCDKDDYVIEDETVHVIWARGTDKLFSSNKLCLSSATSKNHNFVRVRLLTPPTPMVKINARQLAVKNNQLKIPSSDTTYWCQIVKLPDYITEVKHHIVKFESSITKGNEGLVHHMEVFYCDVDSNTEIPMYNGNCFAKDRPEITKSCTKVKAAWAMGALPFVYPEEAGLPLGGTNTNKFIMLEVHYNNPELRSDWVDSSGMVLHVTSQLRRFDAAIMELGLEYTDKMAIPAGQKAFPLTGYCIPECTGVGIPEDGIIVFGSQLHTHLTGIAVWTRQFRRGIELPLLNKDMHYSTHFQEIRILRRPVVVLPGDSLETTCVYNTSGKDNATIGGHAITDEMCVNYIHYYPATQLEVCKSAVSNNALEQYFRFEQKWDNMSISLTAAPRANYLSIKPWTPLRVKALETLYNESPLSMQCNKSDGNRFQGDWEGIPIPKFKVPLHSEQNICPQNYIYSNVD